MKILKINKNNLNRTLKSIEKGYSQFHSKKVTTTESIVEDVRKNGNKALFKYTKKFDNFELNPRNLIVREKEINNAVKQVPERCSEGPEACSPKNQQLPEEKIAKSRFI